MLSLCKSTHLYFNIQVNAGLRSDPRVPFVLQPCIVDSFAAVRLNEQFSMG